MKKFIFALPLIALFTYCSSSRKTAAPPAGPGISNVNVVTGTDTIKGSSIAVTPDTRDWAYSATRDTGLKGTWTLHGFASEDGSWTTVGQPTDSLSQMADSTSVSVTSGDGSEAYHTASNKATTAKSGKTAKRSKSKLQATSSLNKYDSLMANRVIHTDSSLNANVKPYEYWKRLPTVSINPTSLVFTGNTGCNRMSGSFNFSGNDIKFNKNIITSKMACNDYNEAAFLDLLRKADNYAINQDGMLELKQGNTLLLVFGRQS